MQTIFKALGSTLYTPAPDGISMEASPCTSPQAAMRRLLTLLQTFLEHRIEDLGEPPPKGLHTYVNALAGGFLVLAVTDQGASVYAADQADLDRMNLPTPRSIFPC